MWWYCKAPFRNKKATLQVISLLAVIIYTVISAYQLEQIRKTNIATEAEVQVGWAAIRSSESAARPWVGVDDYSVDPLVPGMPIGFTLKLKNTGSRPAIASIVAASAKEPPASGMVVHHYYTATSRPSLLLLPGGSSSLRLGGQGLPKVAAPLNAPQVLTLYVTIQYRDVSTKVFHSTQFCVDQDQGPSSTLNPDPAKQGFSQCGYYQNAD